MSEYTPSTEPYVPTVDEMRAAAESDNPYGSMEPDEFDRGIAKVKADALREAGQGMRAQVERATEYQRFTEHELIEHGIEHVLSEYADRIEREA